MKTLFRTFILILLIASCSEKSSMKVVNVINLKCEQKVNPVGVDIENPRFNWNLDSDGEENRFIKWQDDRKVFEVGSSRYTFTSNWVKRQ